MAAALSSRGIVTSAARLSEIGVTEDAPQSSFFAGFLLLLRCRGLIFFTTRLVPCPKHEMYLRGKVLSCSSNWSYRDLKASDRGPLFHSTLLGSFTRTFKHLTVKRRRDGKKQSSRPQKRCSFRHTYTTPTTYYRQPISHAARNKTALWRDR